MITLRLFHQADPFRQLDSRMLPAGELSIGRDPTAHWVVDDPDCEISRRHCTIAYANGRLTLHDTSSNGVYLGPQRQRAPQNEAVQIEPSDTLHFGQYMILMERAAQCVANDPSPDAADRQSLDAHFHAPILQETVITAQAFAVMSDWAQAAGEPQAELATRPASDASLLDAFCAGARLDASSFAGEDPAEVMRRVGALYQQVVLGLGDLMSERMSLKAEYRMDRTAVGAANNNPFKWAPTQRVAIDLLRTRNDGFLSGPAALKASFEDLKKHLLCLMSGSRSAVSATLDQLNPQQIEEDSKSQSLLFMTKTEAAWRAFAKRYEDLASEARESAESLINQAFKRGYERQLRALDEMGTQS